MICQYPVRPLAAIGECPRCGHIATHHMEAPYGDPDKEQRKCDEAVDTTSVVSWGEETIRRYTHHLGHPTNRHTCDVIRRCVKCQATWGER
jgi:hypothetical protein